MTCRSVGVHSKREKRKKRIESEESGFSPKVASFISFSPIRSFTPFFHSQTLNCRRSWLLPPLQDFALRFRIGFTALAQKLAVQLSF